MLKRYYRDVTLENMVVEIAFEHPGHGPAFVQVRGGRVSAWPYPNQEVPIPELAASFLADFTEELTAAMINEGLSEVPA
jgi:hypothetical protein